MQVPLKHPKIFAVEAFSPTSKVLTYDQLHYFVAVHIIIFSSLVERCRGRKKHALLPPRQEGALRCLTKKDWFGFTFFVANYNHIKSCVIVLLQLQHVKYLDKARLQRSTKKGGPRELVPCVIINNKVRFDHNMVTEDRKGFPRVRNL